jgi:hypothetical protein
MHEVEHRLDARKTEEPPPLLGRSASPHDGACLFVAADCRLRVLIRRMSLEKALAEDPITQGVKTPTPLLVVFGDESPPPSCAVQPSATG